ncbi:hypothetical protein M413DRAFT_447616 [Hebeloma cylindrosporum]|uniref:Uncharacterized protein n=1 Tax=Hebeloma cylindrosporum TaxID=76867 RepID=A0A0C2XLN6_HEBCY|nr:hypothetical protein M413DRAFT_447616 [Hebeloma cylindrosporum h7]
MGDELSISMRQMGLEEREMCDCRTKYETRFDKGNRTCASCCFRKSDGKRYF